MTERAYVREALPELLTPAQFLALPPQPPGTVVRVQADAAAGVIWTLRYNPNSAHASKWEVEAGSPLYSEVAAQTVTISNVTYADIAGSPAIVVPLGGEYDVSHGALIAATASGGSLWQSPLLSGTVAADTDACTQGSQSTAGTGNWYSVGRDSRRVTTAGFNVRMQYKAAGASGSGNAQQRWMKLMPVRVTGP